MIKKLFFSLLVKPVMPSLGVKMGTGTIFTEPRLLDGAQHIQIGSQCMIRPGAWLGVYQSKNQKPVIMIGNDVYIGFSCCITAIESVSIGDGCVISDYFYASDHTHGHDPRKGSPRHQELCSKGQIKIGLNCFIGQRVSILPGIELGEHCVVGAHSVVTKSFPSFSMIAGSPATLIKTFDFAAGTWISAKSVSVKAANCIEPGKNNCPT